MLHTAIKGVFAHKLRLLLTALSIVLGVAFVSGTYVFTDTINARFDTLFTDVYAGIDASVRPEPAEFGDQVGTMPEDLLQDVLAVEGVEAAAASVGGVAQIIDRDGEPIGGQGPPTIGASWVDVAGLNPTRIEEGNGRPPQAAGEVVIDAATADTHGFAPGDDIDIQLPNGLETFEVVGVANFGTEDNLAGATLAIFEFEEAQRLFDLEGRLSVIDVLGADGVSPETLVERIASVTPGDVEVVTGAQQTEETLDDITEGLGFLNTALLAFAGVAVFVSAFIIQNTFRIIVAQRTRELAMLRAVGASRRQVLGMVAIEASIVGLVASAIGVLTGVGVAAAIKAGMNALNLGIPDGPLTVQPRTIAIGMAVGLIVTLVAALPPARKAAAVPPVAAMNETAARPGRRSLRTRSIFGTATTGLGAALLATGLLAESAAGIAVVGLGSLLLFLGVSVLAPLFARPIARLLGRPLPGITGKLARENTIRQPRRTASTASALMIGVALIGFVSIFAASIKASVTDTLEAAFPTDLAFQSTNFNTGVSPAAVAALDELEETATVSAISAGQIRIDGQVLGVAAIEPATVEEVYSPDASIPLSTFSDGFLVQENVAAEQGWEIGDVVDVEYALSGTIATEVVGTFEDQTFANYLISSETFAANFADEAIAIAFADLVPGVGLEEGRAAAEAALAPFPSIDINTKSDQIAEAESAVNQLVAMFSGLLGLAVMIAVLGIANTLALSIVERTREIGLLRAVGMARRQVGRMVRWESLIIALFGALLGIGVGSTLGWAVVGSLADDGLGTFAFPTTELAIWLVVAAVAGVVAAILPARKASRLDVLEAIAYE